MSQKHILMRFRGERLNVSTFKNSSIYGGMTMLMNYLNIGVMYLRVMIPLALIIFCIYLSIKFLIKRRFEIRLLHSVCEFTWILIVLSILSITGIVGGDFSIGLITDGNIPFSFAIFEGGLSMATILNILLFIPFGFLSAVIFKKLRNKWIYGVLIGLIFTIIIEFLQLFTGRFVQLEDILMNTLGTYIGYWICIYIVYLKNKGSALMISKEY